MLKRPRSRPPCQRPLTSPDHAWHDRQTCPPGRIDAMRPQSSVGTSLLRLPDPTLTRFRKLRRYAVPRGYDRRRAVVITGEALA